MPHGGAAQAQIAADLTAPAVLRQLWQRVVTVCLPHPGRQHALRWGWRQKRPYSPQKHAGIFLLLIVLIDGIRRCFLKFYFRFCDFFFSLDEAQYVCLFATAKRPGLQPARFQQISTLSNKIRVQPARSCRLRMRDFCKYSFPIAVPLSCCNSTGSAMVRYLPPSVLTVTELPLALQVLFVEGS